MSELAPLLVAGIVGPLIMGLLYWKFRESRLFLWIGILVTIGLAIWMGLQIFGGNASGTVELGAFIVFCLAALYAFWLRLSKHRQSKLE